MKLLVGLGNTGEKYETTRHNAGFMVVDRLAEKLQNSKSSEFQESKKLKSEVLKTNDLILAKPTTFMNSSGTAVQKLLNLYKIKYPNLWVIHDDLDINLGFYKIQFGVGPKDHNGLLSVYEKLGTADFWHVRIGVENSQTRVRGNGKKIAGESYVLQNFSGEEFEFFQKTLDNVVGDLLERIKNNG